MESRLGNAFMIVVEHLSKSFGKTLAVNDVSFTIDEGEIVGLVGPNGAGKTTSLRTVGGVLAPTSGRILVNGKDIVRQPIEAKAELALVLHDPALFLSLTVWEHIEFTAKVYGLADYRLRAEALLADLEILDRASTMTDELSRGMQQKVALACAFLHDPKAFLLDEPLTGLDPRGIRTVFDLLRKQAERGSAIVISSHFLDQVERLCSKVLILHEGRLLFSGSKNEIKAHLPELEADASLEEIFFRATRDTNGRLGAPD